MGGAERSGPPLKIAYLTGYYARATDTFIRNEVLRLREFGHDVVTYSQRPSDVSELNSDEVRRERANTTDLVPDKIPAAIVSTAKMALTRPLKFLKAARLARKTRQPGLVGGFLQLAYFMEGNFLADEMLSQGVQHLHNHLGEASATVAMLASEVSGIPVSHTIHGPYIFTAPETWQLGEKLSRAAFTACITNFAVSQCMIYTPYEHWDRLHVIHCGPEPHFLTREPPPLPDRPRFVWVGRISEAKGPPLLIDAAARLAREGVEFELVMIGDGALRPQLEEQIQREGLSDRVTLTGFLGGEEVREQIGQARFMVLPSFAEGLPVVIMEALAMGRPVISTEIAGIPELVEPGVNGWLVTAGDVPSLVDAMRTALETPSETVEAMGRAGRERVLKEHDPVNETRKLEALIRASAAGRRPTRSLG